MPAPVPPNLEEPRRVSNAYIPVFMLRHIRAWIVLILIYVLPPILRGEAREAAITTESGFSISFLSLVFIAAGGIVGIILLFSFLSYRRIRWYIAGTDVRIQKGILRRVDKRIPISKIQSIDMTESLPERIFRVATIKIDTPGGEGDDGKIPCVSKQTAAVFRDRIFQIKHTGAESTGGISPAMPAMPTASAGFAGSDNTIYRLPVKNLILTGISNAKTIVFAFIIMSAASQFSDVISDLFLHGSNVYDDIGDYIVHLALPVIVLLAAAFFLISWAISVLAVMASNYGFTVRNAGVKIEVEKGLLSHKTISIEKNRIQDVRIRQGFIRRLIGYAEICVTTATLNMKTRSDSRNSDEVLGITTIHPFIPLKEADYFLRRLLPEFDGAPTDFEALPKRADFRYMRRYFLWALFLVILSWLIVSLIVSSATGAALLHYVTGHIGLVLAISLPILAFFTLTGHRAWRGGGLCRNESFLSLRKGAYGREFAYVPRRKIQTAAHTGNPFQRRAGLATLGGTTAARAFPRLRDVERGEAEAYLEWAVTKIRS
ncbi:MAG: PH domain-containing protein [Clostridiales Family XIII bacterium]|jgi:putative membrane protein|nr:PH domain-containing protein [Clostridiales Family XIII bacterium]